MILPSARRHCRIRFIFIVLAVCLLLVPCIANAAQQQQREDIIMGTDGSSSYMGRDPANGDVIMEATPPPQQQQPQQNMPLIIVPEVRVPYGQGSQPSTGTGTTLPPNNSYPTHPGYTTPAAPYTPSNQ